MKHLALDLGTLTGWALRRDGIVVSGTSEFRPGRYEGGGMRYLRFHNWLEELIKNNRPEIVWFEEVRAHKGVDASHVYGGLMATLTAFCEANAIPYRAVPVGSLKRAATKKGNANKQAMIDAAVALGFNPCDDNEADAIHLLLYAESGVSP